MTPYDEVRDFFHFVDNYIHDLDLAAEQLATELKLGEGEITRHCQVISKRNTAYAWCAVRRATRRSAASIR